MFLPFSFFHLELQIPALRTRLQQSQITSGFSFGSFLRLQYACCCKARLILAILLLSHHSSVLCFRKDYAQGLTISAV